MAIIVPSASEKTLQEYMLGKGTPANQKLKLFTNNVTPDDTFVAASLTEFTATMGYADKTLTMASWTVTAGATGQPATGVYATQTWTFTAGGPVTVYGYFVTDSGSGLLLWVEKFASSQTVQNNGDTIIITPTLTFSRT